MGYKDERSAALEAFEAAWAVKRAAAIESGLGKPSPREHLSDKKKALLEFEAQWVHRCLEAHGGKVTNVSRAEGIDRCYLHRMIRRVRRLRGLQLSGGSK